MQSQLLGPVRQLLPGQQSVEPTPEAKTDLKVGFSYGIEYTPLTSKPRIGVALHPEDVFTPGAQILKLPHAPQQGGPSPSYDVIVDKPVGGKPVVTVLVYPQPRSGGATHRWPPGFAQPKRFGRRCNNNKKIT